MAHRLFLAGPLGSQHLSSLVPTILSLLQQAGSATLLLFVKQASADIQGVGQVVAQAVEPDAGVMAETEASVAATISVEAEACILL